MIFSNFRPARRNRWKKLKLKKCKKIFCEFRTIKRFGLKFEIRRKLRFAGFSTFFSVRKWIRIGFSIVIVFFEKNERLKNAKSNFCEFRISSASIWKKKRNLKFEKNEICVFHQQTWDSVENFEKWKLSQKIEPADINLKISTESGPQKRVDIKISTPDKVSVLFFWFRFFESILVVVITIAIVFVCYFRFQLLLVLIIFSILLKN